MTYTEIVSAVTDRLNLQSTTATTRIGTILNRKYKEITGQLGIRHVSRRVTRNATMSIGISTLQFTNAERVADVWNRNTSAYTHLEEVSLGELRAQQPYAAADTPSQYAVVQMAGDSVTIEVNCIPQTALQLYADVDATSATLSGTDEPVFSESFHDILISLILVDEYMKAEKPNLSKVEYDRVFDPEDGRMGQLRHWVIVSTTKQQWQGKSDETNGFSSTGGSGGSGGGVNGASSYEQTGLITFNREGAGAGSPPFAVDPDAAGRVANLNADLLDGLNSTDFATAADLATYTPLATFNAHHTRHESGGADAIKLDDLSAPDDNTDLNASTTKHGLLKKLSNVATEFLDGTGAFDTVKDSDLATTDITTNDVSASKHGFAPKAPGIAGQFLNGAAGAWAYTPVRIYTATLADITNTVTQTTFLSFTVGANEMADGDVLEIMFTVLLKNNRGGVSSMEVDAFWGATNVRSTDGAAGFAWSNNATERKWMLRYTMVRVGSDLWIFGPQTGTAISLDQINGLNPTTYSGAVTMTPTFTSSATVALKGTFSNADASTYWKLQSAKIRKIS